VQWFREVAFSFGDHRSYGPLLKARQEFFTFFFQNLTSLIVKIPHKADVREGV
jgi:hypothetical protein